MWVCVITVPTRKLRYVSELLGWVDMTCWLCAEPVRTSSSTPPTRASVLFNWCSARSCALGRKPKDTIRALAVVLFLDTSSPVDIHSSGQRREVSPRVVRWWVCKLVER